MQPRKNARFATPACRLAVFLGLGLLACCLFYYSGSRGLAFGVLTLIFLTFFLALGLLALREVLLLIGLALGRSGKLTFFGNIILAVIGLMVGLIGFEVFFAVAGALRPPHIPDQAVPLALPVEWGMRAVHVHGAQRAYYWHGKLHIFDARGMRRHNPFPAKQIDSFRIIVVGDSLTYGVGVAEEETYCRVLEGLLSREYRVEVLNLGILGLQSEDVVKVVKEFAPRLQPNLIIYGICLNDYLPSGSSQTQVEQAYAIPLPEWFKNFLIKNTRVGGFIDTKYDAFLRERGWRRSFLEEILENFPVYRERFARDLKAMQAFATQKGYGPIRTMVLPQGPVYGSEFHRLVRETEEIATQAGMRVVPCDLSFLVYHGKSLRVSPWEGHPSAEAHRIFAELLLPVVKTLPGLIAHRK
jgi:lysophospholipase L1-like esterase